MCGSMICTNVMCKLQKQKVKLITTIWFTVAASLCFHIKVGISGILSCAYMGDLRLQLVS